MNGRRTRGGVTAAALGISVLLGACGDSGTTAGSGTVSIPATATASEVAQAFGCEQVTPTVDSEGVQGDIVVGMHIEFTAAVNLHPLAESEATCFLGPTEVLAFVGGPDSPLLATASSAIGDAEDCAAGETWAYARGDRWIALANQGETQDRYDAAVQIADQVGGTVERVSCDPVGG